MLWLDHYLTCQNVQGRALVVGSKQYNDKADRRRLYDSALGLDLELGNGVDIAHDLEQPLHDTFGLFDHVDCVSVLEHVQRPWLLCANIEKALKVGGTILISVPFVWRVHAYPSDYWRMTPEAVRTLFPSITWETLGFTGPEGWIRKPLSSNINGDVYLAKCEVVGFGVRHPDNA